MKNKRDILKELKAINLKVKSLSKMSFTNYQSWDTLSIWPLGETRNINGTINKKTYEDDNRIEFNTTIPPKTFFEEHWHDFNEKCVVLAGFFSDKLKPEKIYSIGETAFYESNEIHTPGNPSNIETCILRVIFKK